MPPKKKPKKSLSARKVQASSSEQNRRSPLSSFLSNVNCDILREIVKYWIGFPDEDEYQRKTLTARECILRWVLAGLYAAKVEALAAEHYDFGKIRAPAAERCLCPGCPEMPDCFDLRDLLGAGTADFRFDAADLDCFVRISYRLFDRRKQARLYGSQICQGFVTGKPNSSNNSLFGQEGDVEFDFSLGGIYDEAVDKQWWEMTELLGFEARNHYIDRMRDPGLDRRREHLVKGALKSLALTVVAIDRGTRPWRCRLLIATGGYGDIILGQGHGEDVKYLHESYFQLRGIQSHDPLVGDNRVAAAISISDGKLDRLKVRYRYGGSH